jgi:hypothetical protein
MHTQQYLEDSLRKWLFNRPVQTTLKMRTKHYLQIASYDVCSKADISAHDNSKGSQMSFMWHLRCVQQIWRISVHRVCKVCNKKLLQVSWSMVQVYKSPTTTAEHSTRCLLQSLAS